MAVAERQPDRRLARVEVVLVRPPQPGNVGVAARAVANHGLGRLVLVDPPAFDPERARWMAPGAHDVVDGARIVGSIREAVGHSQLVVGTSARRRRWHWPVWGPDDLAGRVLDEPGGVSVLFGPEDAGLSNQDLDLCHGVVIFPTAAHASLNLGQAVTVTCGALMREATTRGEAPPTAARSRPKRAGRRPAIAVDLQSAVATDALQILDATGYLAGRSPDQVRNTLHRWVQRAGLDDQEAAVLRGMLDQVAWRIGPAGEE